MFSIHSDPALEALLPRQVAGTNLTTYSLSLDELLKSGAGDPAAINAFLQSLGKTSADASVAGAFDPTAKLRGTILAYKINGADPAGLLAGIVAFARSDVGATAAVRTGTVGGKGVTIVSAGSGSNDTQWLYARGDVVFAVQAADEAGAAGYLQALP